MAHPMSQTAGRNILGLELDRKFKFFRSCALTAAALVLVPTCSVQAQIVPFNLQWQQTNGTGSATGTVNLDLSNINLPTAGFVPLPSWFSDLKVTVQGFPLGNGTFSQADFNRLIFDNNGVTLDFSKELVGQGGFGTTTGDFNLFSISGAPDGCKPNTLSPSGSETCDLDLVSFIQIFKTLSLPLPPPPPPTPILGGSQALALNNLSLSSVSPIINRLNYLSNHPDTGLKSQVALAAPEKNIEVKSIYQTVSDGISGVINPDDLNPSFTSAWTTPFYGFGGQGGSSSIIGYNFDAIGNELGFDTLINKNLWLGGGFAYYHSNINGTNRPTSDVITSDTYQLTGYAKYLINDQTRISGLASIGWGSNQSSRFDIPSLTQATASYGSQFGVLNIQAEQDVFKDERQTFSPLIRFDYANSSVNSFTDSTGLQLAGQNYQSLVGSAGAKYTNNLSDQDVVTVDSSVGYDFLTQQAIATSTTSSGVVFTTNGITPNSLVVRAGVGYDRKLDKNTDLNVRYDYLNQGGFSSNLASVNLKLSF
jgi:outer membrane autotransporter protein